MLCLYSTCATMIHGQEVILATVLLAMNDSGVIVFVYFDTWLTFEIIRFVENFVHMFDIHLYV